MRKKTRFAFSGNAGQPDGFRSLRLPRIGLSRITVLLCALLIVLLWSASPAAASEGMGIEPFQEAIRPGRAVAIRYSLPEAGACDLVLRAEDGTLVSVVALGLEARAGVNSVYWNGTWQGVAAPEGVWRLCLESGGVSAETPVSVGPMAPCLIGAALEKETVETEQKAVIRYYATEAGTLRLQLTEGEILIPVLERFTQAGEGSFSFSFHLTEGPHALAMTLTGADGTVSETARLTLTVADSSGHPALAGREGVDPSVFTPAWSSPYVGKDPELNYWTAPMDISDEETVWKVLTAPMTVIDNGMGERAQVILRSAPSADSEGLGSVTCGTQGVHVLERGEEWTLVECYSSSFHDSPVLNWNTLVQGYVPTRYLSEVLPNQNLGYVVDKLTQRLYVFMDGHLFSTLLVSTGLSNARQPYNETRSGEFLMTSKVGTFRSDNLSCGLAIRFNKGDLLHEVPYIQMEDGTANYKLCEPKLGTKASHGCIRVQRKRTPEGVSMSWIWSNYKKNTRLIVWEDWQGRQIEMPADDLLVYYNPKGGVYYHSAERCNSVNRQNFKFTAFPYADLDQPPYAKLKRCEYCAPVLRRAEIEAINAVYAVGGDHDPVLTEAREACPRPLK